MERKLYFGDRHTECRAGARGTGLYLWLGYGFGWAMAHVQDHAGLDSCHLPPLVLALSREFQGRPKRPLSRVLPAVQRTAGRAPDCDRSAGRTEAVLVPEFGRFQAGVQRAAPRIGPAIR